MRSFRLEDLSLQIPSQSKTNTKSVTYKGLNSRLSYDVTKSIGYKFQYLSDSVINQIYELTSNPYFACTPIYDLFQRINTSFINSYTETWHSTTFPLTINLLRGYGKFLFKQDIHIRPIHDRWKYLIQEDFGTDGIWPTNADVAVSPFNSTGYGKQVQDIPWEEVSGDWEIDTDFTGNIACGLVGPDATISCLLHNDDVTGMIVAGWDWWENYEVSVWFFNDDAITDDTGLLFHYVDSNEHYRLMNTAASSIGLYNNTTAIMIDTSITLSTDSWNHLKVRIQGSRISCFINGSQLFGGKDIIDTSYVSGRVGLYSALNNTYFDNFRVTLLPPTNFNLPASVDWTNQYSVADIETAHGTQKKLIAPDQNVQFKQSKAGDDCILYLPMNEGQGSVVKDHSSQRINGQINGATWVDDDEKGWCLDFDGTDDNVIVDIGGLLDSDTEVTIEFEVYNYADDTSGGFIGIHRTSVDRVISHAVSQNHISFYNDINDSNEYIMNESITAETWYRITIIISSTGIFSFINGELKGFSAATGLTMADCAPDYLYIGDYDGNHFQHCRIKNIRIFDSSRWDVAYGFDSTPATVFCWDDNRYDSDVDYPDDSDCVLLLHMDEGSGTTTYDASGKGHDASFTTAPDWYDTSFRGEAGTCLDFEDGSTEYLTIADHADFSFAGDVPCSFEAWIKAESLTASHTIISKYGAGAGRREYYFYITSNGSVYLVFFDQNSSANYIRAYTAASEIVIGNWYHIVGTYDGSKLESGIEIYINGENATVGYSEGGIYPGMTATAEPILIGASDAGVSYHWDGLIDEVRVHRRELSANEIAARYRSEPYLHDYYQMTRIYNKTHKFKGLPFISNGLIKLSFPDYDINEYRTANVLIPTIYGWYENSWHMLGHISPRIKLNGTAYYIDSFDASDWVITELTDQTCTMRITYYLSDESNVPEGTTFNIEITIRNGYPGVLIKTSDKDWHSDDSIGYFFQQLILAGMTGYDISFIPEDNLLNSQVDTTSGRSATGCDDNWLVEFYNESLSSAPSKNVIVGHVNDNYYDDLGSSHAFQTLIANNKISGIYNYGYKNSGIFFVPYEVDNLFQEADSDYADVTTDGDNDTQILAGYTGDGYILLHAVGATEYAQWNVGTLSKGSYMAICRSSSGGTANFHLRVDNDNDHDGDLASLTTSISIVDTWEYFFLSFYTDGTNNVWISNESSTGNTHYIDSWFCIPLSNAINYPSDLAHQAFNETQLMRGLLK